MKQSCVDAIHKILSEILPLLSHIITNTHLKFQWVGTKFANITGYQAYLSSSALQWELGAHSKNDNLHTQLRAYLTLVHPKTQHKHLLAHPKI